MPVTELRVSSYRSIRALTLPLKRANIITGANGCGKSNLYRSISLLRAAATGELAHALAADGGVSSVLWAGSRKEGPVRIALGVSVDEFEYDLEIGLPQNATSAFSLDPHIKSEKITLLEKGKKVSILDRGATRVTIRNADGEQESYLFALHHEESAVFQITDPRRFPILDDFRRKLGKWRFYHGFRTDADSPLRQPQVATRTYIMAPDGRDVAAALQTIRENGDGEGLDNVIRDAFPGAKLIVKNMGAGFELGMQVPGMNRPLRAAEFSDGQLRYLCLVASLMSPNPAPLIALNEPETSLHQDLIAPLARLCAEASLRSQLWLTTHSQTLADQLGELINVKPIALEKVEGETVRAGRSPKVYFSSDDE